jgi:RimJ/RimL family protein N-acetyltransferase/GNAT superfamily N-acetyltransferase
MWRENMDINNIVLRDVTESDLQILYEHQLDPIATSLADFPSREQDTFTAHWKKIMADEKNILKTILFKGKVAGNIVSWERDGEQELGYWLGREYWGKGIATAALKELSSLIKIRPLYARVSTNNIASRRVLEKCGFVVYKVDEGFFLRLDEKHHDDFILRPATDKDAAAVTACVHHAFHHYIERIGREPGPMLMDYEHEISEHQVFVVEENGQIVGALVLCIKDEGFLLDVIAVEPLHQGRGVGKLLLEFAETEARRQGFTSIYLYTHEKMTENQALYTRIGYVEYDRRFENGLSRIYMRKKFV